MALTLAEIRTRISSLDREAMAAVQSRLDILTKPKGSLGVLEDLALLLAGITGTALPEIKGKAVIIMAADHGVAAERVSAYPSAVTAQMVQNFVDGGAAINVLARHAGARVVVVDAGVATDLNLPGVVDRKVRRGTGNMAQEPAMTPDEAVIAIEHGIAAAAEVIASGANLIATGDMGIGNTTASSAILAACSGLPPAKLIGRGTGVDDYRFQLKAAAVAQALAVNRPDPRDALDVLRKVGGLEIAGLTGVILGCAAHRVPVLIDGFISGAAALVAAKLEPRCRDFMIASHLSEEPGHKYMLEMLDLKPLLQMRLRLGEGTGAVLAMHLVEAAGKVLREMATFASAGVAVAL